MREIFTLFPSCYLFSSCVKHYLIELYVSSQFLSPKYIVSLTGIIVTSNLGHWEPVKIMVLSFFKLWITTLLYLDFANVCRCIKQLHVVNVFSFKTNSAERCSIVYVHLPTYIHNSLLKKKCLHSLTMPKI